MEFTPTHQTQTATYPYELGHIVEEMNYRPGWKFELEEMDRGQGSEGLTFKVLSLGYDSYHPDRGENYRVWHYFPVPPAAFDHRAWERWVLDCLIQIETHETCEFFQIGDDRPFAPNHGPGRNPYSVIEVGTAADAATSFRGELNV